MKCAPIVALLLVGWPPNSTPVAVQATLGKVTGAEIPLNATIQPGHSLQDDGLGTYYNRKDEQEIYLNHRSGTNPTMFALVVSGHDPVRYHRYDLTRPVPASGAISLGLFKGSGGDDFFMTAPVNATVTTLDAMAVGMTTDADSFEIRLGQGYSLVFGDRGAFYGQGGAGTTKARIVRQSMRQWRLELPPGSLGRLWLRPQGTLDREKFIDRGLYQFDGIVELVAQ